MGRYGRTIAGSVGTCAAGLRPRPVRRRGRAASSRSVVAIVGAGASGLLTALALVDAGRCDPTDIRIIDATVDTGRVCTHRTPAGGVMELGAGRISTTLHPRTWGLLKRFNIAFTPFDYALRYQDLPVGELDDFRNLDLRLLPAAASFHEALVATLGPHRADRFCTSTGYEALRDPRLPVAAGIEIVSTHPESFQGTALRHTWCSPAKGFSHVLDVVRQHLITRGVQFMRPWTAVELTGHAGEYRLHLLDDLSHRAHVIADRVVLAMAPSDLDAIRLPDGVDLLAWTKDVVTVPLFKGFLTYDHPWWDDYGFRNTCLITSDAAQKVYFDSTSRAIFCYADSRNARMWHRADAAGRTRVGTEITRRVARASGLPLSSLTRFTDSACTSWATGISYVGTQRPDPGLGRLAPGIGLVNDAVTPAPGWLEGSFQAADHAWDLLRLHPSWSRRR